MYEGTEYVIKFTGNCKSEHMNIYTKRIENAKKHFLFIT